MNEKFTALHAGDLLSARRVNRLGRVAERLAATRPGTNMLGRHSDQLVSQSAPPPWKQGIAEVVGQFLQDGAWVDGLYEVSFRWYSYDEDEWKTEETFERAVYNLDARDLGVVLLPYDRLMVFWDDQRGMFVPAGPVPLLSYADGNNTYNTTIYSTGVGSSDIRFALEKMTGSQSWGVVNNRTCHVNGNVLLRGVSDGRHAFASGCMVYTITAQRECWLRIRAETDLVQLFDPFLYEYPEVDVDVIRAALRVRDVDRIAINETVGSELSNYATTVQGYLLEGWANTEDLDVYYGEVKDDVNDPLEIPARVPRVFVQSDRLRITTPLKNKDGDKNSTTDTDFEQWTLQVEVAVVFRIYPGGSSSSSSSSSSASTSSISTSSSSISTSSSSMSTSSSSVESSCMAASLRGLDTVPGYDNTKKQALTHNHGCLKWMDIEECP